MISTTMKTEVSDETLLSNIERKFSMLRTMTLGVANHKINGMVVSGDGGVGKTYTVEETLHDFHGTRKIKSISGKISPVEMFNNLYNFSGEDDILIFDDADAAFKNDECLNILKAALDTKPRRMVSWLTSSKLVETDTFEMKGRVIVLTNQSLGNDHYKAFLTRVHTFPMNLTPREKVLRIKQIASANHELPQETANEVVSFLLENYDHLGPNLSLRTFVKTSQLVNLTPDWKELAEHTIFSQKD